MELLYGIQGLDWGWEANDCHLYDLGQGGSDRKEMQVLVLKDPSFPIMCHTPIIFFVLLVIVLISFALITKLLVF